MSTKDINEKVLTLSSKEERLKEIRYKLQNKIKEKQIHRMNYEKKKKEVDDYYRKIGISDNDIKELTELSEKLKKKKCSHL